MGSLFLSCALNAQSPHRGSDSETTYMCGSRPSYPYAPDLLASRNPRGLSPAPSSHCTSGRVPLRLNLSTQLRAACTFLGHTARISLIHSRVHTLACYIHSCSFIFGSCYYLYAFRRSCTPTVYSLRLLPSCNAFGIPPQLCRTGTTARCAPPCTTNFACF